MNFIHRNLRLALWLFAFVLSAPATAQLVPGRDYRIVSPTQPTESGKRVEVLEFFWYACPHCNNLQRPLKAWLKQKPADVDFRRVPAVLDSSWMPLTLAYHAIEAMGAIDKLHDAVFAAIHEQKIRLSDQNVLFDWIAQHGVDRQKFADTYNSFGVRSRAQRSADMTRNFDVAGTPALAVDGKYLVAPSMTLRPDKSVDYDRFFQVLDQTIAMARKQRAGK